MKFASLVMAGALVVSGAGSALAQSADGFSSDTRVAPGVVAPFAPRAEANGDVSPPPALTITGGIGANEDTPPTRTQSRSGGPSGGNGLENGGG